MTLAYERGEIVDQFAYTNSIYHAAPEPGWTNFVWIGDQTGTGQGWDGPWTGDTDKWFIEDGSIPTGDSGYPTPHANKLKWIDTNSVNAASAALVRKLQTPRAGRIFAAFIMNYQYNGAEKWMGLSFMSGDNAETEELFFGKVYSQDRRAGINDPGTDPDTETVSAYDLTPGHGNDFMIVAEYDPDQKTARMWAFYVHDADPIPEGYSNAVPIAVYSNDLLSVGQPITGIRLAAGSGGTDGSWSNELGHLVFDEIRVGNTWDEVLNFTYPLVYDFTAGYAINQTNWVSDGQLAQPDTNYPVAFNLYHRTRIKEAKFTLLDLENSSELYTPLVFVGLSNTLGSGVQVFTNLVVERLPTNEVALSVYTSRVWVTSTSDKQTNTIVLSERAGADDLFFGEFGEGNSLGQVRGNLQRHRRGLGFEPIPVGQPDRPFQQVHPLELLPPGHQYLLDGAWHHLDDSERRPEWHGRDHWQHGQQCAGRGGGGGRPALSAEFQQHPAG
jgi:hypothetical protein